MPLGVLSRVLPFQGDIRMQLRRGGWRCVGADLARVLQSPRNRSLATWDPDQTFLYPPSPRDWLPENDLVYFLIDTVATLDLTPIFSPYEREN